MTTDFERDLAVELLRYADGVQRDPHDRRRWVQARRFLLVAAEEWRKSEPLEGLSADRRAAMEKAAHSWLSGGDEETE